MISPQTFSYEGTELERASKIAGHISKGLANALDEKSMVTFLASGGRSPGRVLSALSRVDLDWARVIVSLSDERQVSKNHSHSNLFELKSNLLKNNAECANIIPLWDSENDASPEAALYRLGRELEPYAPFDVALIGMGMDGHTASVFPKGKGMDEALTTTNAFVFTTPDPLPSEAPWPRITVSLPTLAATSELHLMLFGTEKATLFNHFIGLSDTKIPIAILANLTGNKLLLHTST